MSGLKTALTVTTAAVVGTVAYAQSASAADVTLRMANWAGTAHHMYHYTLPQWFEDVKKQTNGRVEIIYDKVMLTKSQGLYDLARDGVRDITWSNGSQNPGRFELARFGEVPYGSPNATTGSKVIDTWYRKKHKLFEREMPDVKFLFAWQPGSGMIHTNKKIEKMEDLVGLKLRATSGDVIISKALGAVPVTIQVTQAYEALQRGTIDGTFFPMEGIHSFRLKDLVKFHLQQPGAGLYSSTFYAAMNPKTWDSMPADIREAFLRAVDNGPEIVGGGWDEFDLRSAKEATENGNTVYKISTEEAERWRKTVYAAGTVEEIIKRGETAGHKDARDLMTDLLKMYSEAGS
jgi:TRAP-type C4-dicarboxylate transport system substrate-binding protein